jgi:inhibitor of KinA
VVRFQPASDDSLLVYFGESITPEAHQSVLRLLRSLETQPISGIRNLHPAYNSILIRFNALGSTHADLESALRPIIERLDSVPLSEPRLVEVPVSYGGDFGPDLAALAALRNLSTYDVIEAHSSATYTVAFLGFVPGFAYLAGLPEKLATPRLSAPRRQVPDGSLGIAGNQTGIYPFSTPGGWRLIGRTPLQMFRAGREPMSLLTVGDRVRFVPISLRQFEEIHFE